MLSDLILSEKRFFPNHCWQKFNLFFVILSDKFMSPIYKHTHTHDLHYTTTNSKFNTKEIHFSAHNNVNESNISSSSNCLWLYTMLHLLMHSTIFMNNCLRHMSYRDFPFLWIKYMSSISTFLAVSFFSCVHYIGLTGE